MATEYSVLYEPLLEWVYEQADGSLNEQVNLVPFAMEHNLARGAEYDLLQYAVDKRGLKAWSGLSHVAASLTTTGLEQVERRRERRNSPVQRSKATRQALLRWLWTMDHEGRHLPGVGSFIDTPEAQFEGSPLTADEIDRAAAYLLGKGLIDGIGTDQSRGPVRAYITVKGQDCVENYDADSTAFDRHGRGGTVYNNYMPNAQGVIMGEQQHFTQNNTNGVDPTLFAQLAGYIGQVSTTLGMSDPDRVELERVAQDLHAEATSPNPEPSRLRQLATQLRDKLLEAGTTIAATMGVQMAGQALAVLAQ
ncbi:hypothetical protein [Streptomyces uncialis]|uniref:hypothetical protein n=1 Tax=Streptomyces uncialis TaxID=1048205 RepID=UPI00379699EF